MTAEVFPEHDRFTEFYENNTIIFAEVNCESDRIQSNDWNGSNDNGLSVKFSTNWDDSSMGSLSNLGTIFSTIDFSDHSSTPRHRRSSAVDLEALNISLHSLNAENDDDINIDYVNASSPISHISRLSRSRRILTEEVF